MCFVIHFCKRAWANDELLISRVRLMEESSWITEFEFKANSWLPCQSERCSPSRCAKTLRFTDLIVVVTLLVLISRALNFKGPRVRSLARSSHSELMSPRYHSVIYRFSCSFSRLGKIVHQSADPNYYRGGSARPISSSPERYTELSIITDGRLSGLRWPWESEGCMG